VAFQAALTQAAALTAEIDLARDASPEPAWVCALFHEADEFVAQDSFEVHVTTHDLQVRVAYARHLDTDERVIFAGRSRRRDLAQRDSILLAGEGEHVEPRAASHAIRGEHMEKRRAARRWGWGLSPQRLAT
jgi:hypothetical protein